MIITIDGPAASGKSTVSLLLAKKIGFTFLDSGSFFRAFSYVLKTYGMCTDEDIAHITTDRLQKMLAAHPMGVCIEDAIMFPCLSGKKLTNNQLRAPEISRAASILGANGAARDILHGMQHEITKGKNVVVNGRDAGSVVFAHAPLKFFLTAHVTVRAARWQAQQAAQGNILSMDQAIVNIQERDNRDQMRAIDPLIVPEGAIIIDNSDIDISDTLLAMYQYYQAYKQKSG